jgi:hypothetical protein
MKNKQQVYESQIVSEEGIHPTRLISICPQRN